VNVPLHIPASTTCSLLMVVSIEPCGQAAPILVQPRDFAPDPPAVDETVQVAGRLGAARPTLSVAPRTELGLETVDAFKAYPRLADLERATVDDDLRPIGRCHASPRGFPLPDRAEEHVRQAARRCPPEADVEIGGREGRISTSSMRSIGRALGIIDDTPVIILPAIVSGRLFEDTGSSV
jgi:hypothetical protein